mgnify:FL=1
MMLQVEQLNKESSTTIEDVARTAVKTRRFTWALAVSLALDVALTTVLGLVIDTQQDNSDKIAAVVRDVETAQGIQRQEALCPLYQLFLDSESKVPPNQTPEQLAERTKAFGIIHKSYDSLECAKLK